MMLVTARTSLLALTLGVLLCACLYQQQASASPAVDARDELQSLIGAFQDMALKSSADASFINPFRFILRIINFVTFAPRFIFRFITTMLAVLVLSIAGCEIFPEVNCVGFDVHERIQEFISMLREEFDFYLDMANIQDS